MPGASLSSRPARRVRRNDLQQALLQLEFIWADLLASESRRDPHIQSFYDRALLGIAGRKSCFDRRIEIAGARILPARRALDAIIEDFRQVRIGIEDLLVLLLLLLLDIDLLLRASGDDCRH